MPARVHCDKANRSWPDLPFPRLPGNVPGAFTGKLRLRWAWQHFVGHCGLDPSDCPGPAASLTTVANTAVHIGRPFAADRTGVRRVGGLPDPCAAPARDRVTA